MNTRLATLQRIIAQQLAIPAESIHAEDGITALANIDSLSFEMIIAAIEKERGRAAMPQELVHLETVGDLAQLL